MHEHPLKRLVFAFLFFILLRRGPRCTPAPGTPLSVYYFYEETIKRDIDKSIELLIKSSNEFEYSLNLLCIVLIKRFGFNFELVKYEIDKRIEKTNKLYETISTKTNFIINLGKQNVDSLYETYKNKDFLYDVLYHPICTSDLIKEISEKTEKNPNLKIITKDFYEGFGDDLI